MTPTPNNQDAVEHVEAIDKSLRPEDLLSPQKRFYVIAAALLTLFLGALDALVMSAAMPTITTDLGGFHLYSWVYSAYLLARAVSLPIFGKLADIFKSKNLYVISILIFLAGSVLAGLAQSMTQLILSRLLQGVGAGGNFALVYIVLTDMSSPENRGKTLSLASFIWGLASVLGPTFGGFVVTYFSWRWIFFLNVPLGLFSLLGVILYLVEVRPKKKDASIDYWGVFTLSVAILGLLTVFLLAGRDYAWTSPQILVLAGISLLAAIAFYHAEKRAPEPILSLGFFSRPGFSIGNAAAFLASFTIFALFAYTPIFIQEALGKSPLQMSVAMLSLSLGWSLGALACGQMVNRLGQKASTVLGALFLSAGGVTTLTFSTDTSLAACTVVLGIIGIGMGFVSMATLLVVQDSLDITDLGIATASHQFSRTLGGTIGVGIAGGIVTQSLSDSLKSFLHTDLAGLSPALAARIEQSIENIFRPEFQMLLTPEVQHALREAVSRGVAMVFWIALLASAACLVCSVMITAKAASNRKR